MASSWDIDKAIVSKLLSDAPLMALAPHGVWRNIAPQGSTRFVEFELLGGTNDAMFGGRAFENPTYRVMYVEKSSSDLNAIAAADRIEALLDWKPLTVAGYGQVIMELTERIGYPDIDEANARWQHFGGLYEVKAALA
jgi:hypothetical protein